MRYIELNFIPFKINTNYRKCVNELKTTRKVKLFNLFDANIKISKVNAFKTYITFLLDSIENYNEIHELLVKAYGNPMYVSDNIPNVWKIDDVYLEHKLKKLNPDESKHTINISTVNKFSVINVERFNEVKCEYKKIASSWNLFDSKFSCDGMNDEIYFSLFSDKYEYFAVVFKNKITITINELEELEDGGYTLVNSFKTTNSYNGIDEIFQLFGSFFVYVMGKDKTINKPRYLNANVKFYSTVLKKLPDLENDDKLPIIFENDNNKYYVDFLECNVNAFDEFSKVKIKFLYPGIEDSTISKWKNFKIYKGSKVIGEGIVESVEK